MQRKWMVVFTALVLLSLIMAPVGTVQAATAWETMGLAGFSVGRVEHSSLAFNNSTKENDTAALLDVTWYVETTGDDSNSCTAPASPCATIQGAINKAAAGDVINVAMGTYNDPVSTDKSIQLMGGWDNTFSIQNGISIVDTQYIDTGRPGLSVASMDPFITVDIDRFIIQRGGRGGITVSNAILTISNSTVRDNRGTGIGASINNTIVLNNVTITGNGRGIYSYFGYGQPNTITINNSTIANNFVGFERDRIGIDGGVITIRNSILANNTAAHGADCLGTIDVSEHNIIEDFTGCAITTGTGNQINVDPLIGAFPIGSFQYHALRPDSPAINTGNSVTCLDTDIRGVDRPQGGICDIGAYEYVSSGTANSFGIIRGIPQKTAPSVTFSVPFAVYVTDAMGNPVSGATINFVAPASGASGTFADSGTIDESVFTDNEGIAIASPFTANAQAGNYNVTATVNGLPGSLSFALTNAGLYVSPTGSDLNSCNLPSLPCATINKAIEKSNDGDTILVATGTYTSASNIVPVVTVNKDVSILGGWNSTFTAQNDYSIIDGQNTKMGIEVRPDSSSNGLFNTTLDHFIVQNGREFTVGGLYASSSTLTIKHSVIRNNVGRQYSGAGIKIWNTHLVIIDSLISGNRILDSDGNDYYGNGGGINVSSGSLIIQNSTVANNKAGNGGGIYLDVGATSATLVNVTLSGNQARSAGALYGSNQYVPLHLSNVTVTNNVVTNIYHDARGGGIVGPENSGNFVIENSLIAGNTADVSPDCVGAFISRGHNLIGSGEGCATTAAPWDQIGEASSPIDPMLGDLSNNGGPTPTHALLNGSPAINAGDDSTCPSIDQRGVFRPQGVHCDIGAFEFDEVVPDTTPPTVTSILRANADHTSAASVNFTVTFSEPVLNVDANDFTLNVTGTITGASVGSVTGSGTMRTVTVNTGSGNGTLRLNVRVGASITDAAGNPITGLPFTGGETYTVLKAATFSDVETGYWSWQYVERLVNAGITAGCGGGQYCPEATVTRAQMAVFLERGMKGASYSPPAVGNSTGFGDVPLNHWAAAWIKQLAADGITGGCGSGNYCPESPVTRAQMAIFLLKAKYGSSYSPPAVGGSTGFGDVDPSHWASAWIKQLVTEGITAGCGSGNYCPEAPVTRAQMAVFLVRTFNLP